MDSKVNRLMSLNEILIDNSAPPNPIIDNGILLEESLLLISGQKKVRKSFLAYNLALAIASGNSFSIFEITNPQKVLVLSAEGGWYPNRDRIKKMALRVPQIDHNNLIICTDARYQLDIEKDHNTIKEVVLTHKPKVLVIDPLVRFHSQNENQANSMSLVMGRIRHLIGDCNISIILVHHDGKSFDADARGSSVILGEYDSYIQVMNEDAQKFQQLRFDMRHVATPDPINIRFNSDTFWFESIYKDTECVSILNSYGPLSKSELVKSLIESGRYNSEGGAYKRIDRENKDGSIKLVEGKYTLPENSPLSNSPGEL